jgi:hypothetical protein
MGSDTPIYDDVVRVLGYRAADLTWPIWSFADHDAAVRRRLAGPGGRTVAEGLSERRHQQEDLTEIPEPGPTEAGTRVLPQQPRQDGRLGEPRALKPDGDPDNDPDPG